MADAFAPLVLIEDDAALRLIITRYLRGHGYRVVEADSAEDAKRRLADLQVEGVRPRLVLLDLNLPGETGWDLLRGELLSRAGNPPVVITSAVTVSPRRLEEFHVAGYLPKPFPLETLVDTIERLVVKEGAHPTP